MSKKRYVLELTGKELQNVDWVRGTKFATPEIAIKLYDLAKQAKADADHEDLRLPWRAELCRDEWYVRNADNTQPSIRAFRLMSAAPELFEAVQAMRGYMGSDYQDWPRFPEAHGLREGMMHLVERALRKAATGVAE